MEIAEKEGLFVRSKLIFFVVTGSIFLYSASSAEALGPMSEYCRAVETQLKKTCKPSPEFGKGAGIDVEVDASGKIDAVRVSKFNEGQQAGLEPAMAILKTVPKIIAPPASAPKPLWLLVEFGDNLEDFDVGWRDVDYAGYMQNVQSKVKSCWNPPRKAPTNRCALAFRIHDDGRISDLRLATKSGINEVDQAALAAATRAAPFPALPDGSPEHVFILFSLDFNQHTRRF